MQAAVNSGEFPTLETNFHRPLNLTEEQILTLAPDESSKKSGKDLANPAKWVTKAISDRAIWGECQGSGSKPYQTQADLTNLAFKCSCPSRKFPCKHGLGLLLLNARQPSLFEKGNEPAWVSEWLNKRVEKEEKKKEPEKPIDEAAQARRQQARQQKVEDGTAELLLWIKDIIRGGILQAPDKTPAFWENMARRMVDAQAPGLAGMVRTLGNTSFFQEGWQTLFLDQLLRIYLILSGFRNNDQLDPTLQDDISGLIGFTVSQDELKEKPGVVDNWLVLGKQSSEDQGLTVERYWLSGATTGTSALILQFLVRGRDAQLTLTPGLSIRAELVFYPSAAPLRALIKRQIATEGAGSFKSIAGWDDVLVSGTDTCSVLPVFYDRPYIVEQLLPVWHQQQWWLQDRQQQLMPLKENSTAIWKILSLSGGERLNMAVIGKENLFEPIGVWFNNEYKPV